MSRVYLKWIIVRFGVILSAICMRAWTASLTAEELVKLAENLVIKAEVVDNMWKSLNLHKVKITLQNGGTDPLPSSGWVLYFYSNYLLYPNIFPKNKSVDLDTEHIKVNMIQGQLYSLEPISGFMAIAANTERDYEIEAQFWSVSRTDFFPYWYVVSTNPSIEPRIVKSTSSFGLEYVQPFDDPRQWKRFNCDRYNPYTAQERWRRLHVQDSGKADKLVIPTPKYIKTDATGPTLTVDPGTWRIYKVSAESADNAVYLNSLINMYISEAPVNENVITLNISPDVGSRSEAYTVEIKPAERQIILKGRDKAGLFYAIQSLYSIMQGYDFRDIPKITISDEPRFPYRGMFVDVARNFKSVDDLTRLMKVMAMYKLNKLHLHLADDEGWRLEIPTLPELAQIGGHRCHDLTEDKCVIPQWGSGPFTNSSGSGFFTSSAYQSILNFAVRHQIEVIPEFDMPGHAHAAIVSMDARYRKFSKAGNEAAANEFRLKDADDTSEYISVQQWLDNAMNPCINSTYRFIETVLDEVLRLHKEIQPLQTYHFGGDGVAANAWEGSARCKEFKNQNPKYNITKGLKRYFAERVSRLTADKGVGMRGWEDGFVDKDGVPFPLDSMENTNMSANPFDNVWEWGAGHRAYSLANAGYKVVMSQATDLYFDHPYEPDPEERGLYWATRFTDTYKTFGFQPDSLYANIEEERSGKPITVTDICGEDMSKCPALVQRENVIGLQAHLWGETILTRDNMDYMIFPRLLAVAERAWYKASFEEEGITPEEKQIRLKNEWKMFANTLGHKELLRLDQLGIMYRVPPPGGRVRDHGNIEISTSFPGLVFQISYDNGTTWTGYIAGSMPQLQNGHVVYLKTLSADKQRYSRVIKLQKDEPLPWTIQPTIDYIADHVTVQVGVVDNVHKVDGYSIMELALTNTGSEDIPTGTWKIYFYSMYGAKNENLSCGLTTGRVNGALYYFTPTDKSFKIEAGGTLKCIFHHLYWNVARTDHFPNWYVGSLGMDAKNIKQTMDESLAYIKPFDTIAKWKRQANDKFNPYTLEERYNMYSNTNTDVDLKGGAVIPTPFNVTNGENAVLKYDRDWMVVNTADFKFEAQFLTDQLSVRLTDAAQNKYIQFTKASVENGEPEAYKLDIDPKTESITITAEDNRGALHGVQTLIGLIEHDNGAIAEMSIIDKPRFSYRGVMLDSARNFKPKEWIMRFLDVMSMYKLNTLHFHLTEDEAWRMDIPGIPELTKIGSQRCQSDYTDTCVIPQLGSGADTNSSGSGFYSVEDYQDILKYANDRHITVIPEVDLPGHSSAAISAMAYRQTLIDKQNTHGASRTPMESYVLSDVTTDTNILSPQKWTANVVSPCLNTTFRFIEKVVDEFIEIHKNIQPLKIFHIGGDEVPLGVFDHSPSCKKHMDNGQSHDDIVRMFIVKVDGILASRGLNMAAWEDGVYADNRPIPASDFKSSEIYSYTWNSRWDLNRYNRSAEFANAGYKVVLPFATHLYFDQSYEPDPEERGSYWASRQTDSRKVFNFLPDNIYANADVTRFGDPIDMGKLCEGNSCPVTNKPENIVGMEATMFSEVMRTEEQFHYMAFPRLLALAERAWHKASWEYIDDATTRNVARDKDWFKFVNALGYKELPRLEKHGITYRIPPPGAKIEKMHLLVNTLYPNHIIELSTDQGKTWSSIKYSRFLKPGYYNLQLRSRSKILGRSSRTVELQVDLRSGVSAGVIPRMAITFTTFPFTANRAYTFDQTFFILTGDNSLT